MENMTNCWVYGWPQVVSDLGFLAFLALLVWLVLRDEDK